jgi:Glycosidases
MRQDSEWWRGAVIYQIYPRSFQDSDGDGIGDLKGIVDRLEHVAKLGADAVWLSPINRSPMEDMGYDVSDYYDIDPLFGTLADFDALLARAHELGLRVIIDQVLSHSSDRHPWFADSRQGGAKADWYVWADAKPDGSPPNNWQSNFGGSAWEWAPGRGQYYLHNFLISQPDLNLRNPEVQDELLRVLRFWLDRGWTGSGSMRRIPTFRTRSCATTRPRRPIRSAGRRCPPMTCRRMTMTRASQKRWVSSSGCGR